MSDWIIIKTKRSKEFWAKENLIRQKFEIYIPLTYRQKKYLTKSKLQNLLYLKGIFL